ncbi:crosslink repair DNA glycosylase YcaQ family protein [uncultured Agrococcus sp.]|uniref:winged helix-turn-helix domain-containing protein n=1 Tax=uncultured Agrococcus sp. TaxID=382258 RepID=UPI0025E4E1C1|nr:crosslink repair DNA glycosylase YcaQ family protein [uncultured Agrococcus sp.]
MPETISAKTARAIALDAQGLTRPASPGLRGQRTALERIGLLQLDSVNVYERSHYTVAAARTQWGSKHDLDRMVHHDHRVRKAGNVTETWAHQAALIPLHDLPLFEFRERAFLEQNPEFFSENAALHREILAQFRDLGPLSTSEIEHEENVRLPGGWWNKNLVHQSVSMLFLSGQLVVTGRRRFERVLDLRERVAPEATSVTRQEQVLELMRRASIYLGVATLDDLRDYFRIRYLTEARDALHTLIERGEVQEVAVHGWDRPAYLAAGQRLARSLNVDALLSPFDPLVWYRPRAVRLWGFEYRISIYTPEHKREHGYYVLPVMIGGEIVGRVDLKRDRKADALLVRHANIEPSHAHREAELTPRLGALLRESADWHGLSDVHTNEVVGTWSLPR